MKYQGAYTAENLVRVPEGLPLPLRYLRRIEGNAGYGASVPNVVPTPAGVLVNRRGCLALYSNDLSTELWRQVVDGWGSGPFVLGSSALLGPVADFLWEYDVASGALLRRIPFSGIATVNGVEGDICLVVAGGEGRLYALDWSGQVVWERAALPGHTVTAAGRVLIDDDLHRAIYCLDAATGRIEWRFEVPREGLGDVNDRSNLIPSGFPSLAVVGERVIVITMGFRVLALSLETGQMLAAVRPPFVGRYLVTERSIFFKQAFGLCEFDHHGMKEASRIEYRQEVEPLYKGSPATVNAFWLTDQSVVWTTAHGAVMGVSRGVGPRGERTVWVDEIQGALLPLAVPPISYDNYLYVVDRGARSALHCYGASVRMPRVVPRNAVSL